MFTVKTLERTKVMLHFGEKFHMLYGADLIWFNKEVRDK